MEITKDMTLRKIMELPCFAQMQGQFVSTSMGDWFQDKYDLTLPQLQQQNPTWFHEDLLYGLNRLQEVASEKEQYVYEAHEGVRLIHLPAKKKKYDTCAILMAGGAYGAVCTLGESLPVAARLNELRMDCFCLNYRTATKSSFLKGLMPQPMEDLASAWKFIKTNEARFGVNAENYIVGGFSAGGHLAAMWGTPHRGARAYGIPNPKLLMLVYPLISMENLHGPGATMIGTGMFGAGFGKKKVQDYAAHRHVDEDYPSVYLVQAEDDDTVPIHDSYDMETALKASNVRHSIERPVSGGHGFGLGSATPAKGWVEQALHFMDGE